MEEQLFSWDDWDIQDTMCFTFYDVELKRDIGKFKVGSKFSNANIDYAEGKLHLYTDDSGENYHTFNLTFNISE